jgi:hypothetical protein
MKHILVNAFATELEKLGFRPSDGALADYYSHPERVLTIQDNPASIAKLEREGGDAAEAASQKKRLGALTVGALGTGAAVSAINGAPTLALGLGGAALVAAAYTHLKKREEDKAAFKFNSAQWMQSFRDDGAFHKEEVAQDFLPGRFGQVGSISSVLTPASYKRELGAMRRDNQRYEDELYGSKTPKKQDASLGDIAGLALLAAS